MKHKDSEHPSERLALRIEKRTQDMSPYLSWGIRAAALVAALLVCALIIWAIVHINPLRVYAAMFQGTFGTNSKMWVTIRDICMLVCIGVGLAPTFKMRFWNIGAEGQVLVGGLAAAACMIYFNHLPTGILLLMMLPLSAVAGGVWGFVPGVFKAKWNTNETLFTLMMNYIALQLTAYFVALWENPYGSNTVGVINGTTKAGWFPRVLGQQYLLNVIIVAVLVIGMYFYLRNSKQGYEIAVVGESENTARYAGIRVPRVVTRTVTISGAICGVAGFLAVAGASHTISTSTAGGKGFTAIIVAWMAKFNTFVMVLISALLVFLDKGSIEIATQFGLSDHVSKMLTGIILFFVLGSEFFIEYKLHFRAAKEGEK